MWFFIVHVKKFVLMIKGREMWWYVYIWLHNHVFRLFQLSSALDSLPVWVLDRNHKHNAKTALCSQILHLFRSSHSYFLSCYSIADFLSSYNNIHKWLSWGLDQNQMHFIVRAKHGNKILFQTIISYVNYCNGPKTLICTYIFFNCLN